MTQNQLLLHLCSYPTEKAKHGACPFIPPAMCLLYEPPQCHSDWQCPKKQKCCPGLCGIKCLDPVDPSKPGEEVESWKRGPGTFKLEGTHPGEVGGLDGGAEPGLVHSQLCILSQLGRRWASSQLASQSISQLTDCSSSVSKSVCLRHNTDWGPLVRKSLLQDLHRLLFRYWSGGGPDSHAWDKDGSGSLGGIYGIKPELWLSSHQLRSILGSVQCPLASVRYSTPETTAWMTATAWTVSSVARGCVGIHVSNQCEVRWRPGKIHVPPHPCTASTSWCPSM